MAYERQYHTNGDVLEARQLNHMETGIKENSDSVSKLSEDIADLKENGTGTGGTGITTAMATALDNMFKVCAYTKADVSEEYNAFRTAFGLEVVLIPATAVTLTASTLSFTTLNDSQTLKATLEPTDSTDSIAWSSSDEMIAKVVDGVVTAVGEGTATITATATSGVKATCSVNIALDATVYTVTNTLENVTTSNSATTVEEGTTYIAYLTVADGYELTAPIITMGGVDITATAYANGTVSITSVTGNIEITAIATEINTVIYELAEPLVCDGVNYVDTGVVVCGTGNLYSKDFTIVGEFEIDTEKIVEISGSIGGIAALNHVELFNLANDHAFRMAVATGAEVKFKISSTNINVTRINLGSDYETKQNDTVKFAICHVAGTNSASVFGISENIKELVNNSGNGGTSGFTRNIPYTLALGAYYDADTNGNIVPSEFRGTIKQFAIHNEVWSDEAINEFLGVE